MTSGATSDQTAMALSEIREFVDADKTLASEVIREARSEMSSFKMVQITPDITGKPDGTNQFNRHKRERIRNLETVTRSPFFARYRTMMTMNGQTEEMNVLITEAGGGSTVFHDGWLLTTWTHELGLKIRSAKPGETKRIEVGRGVTTFDVDALSNYEELLPQVKNGRFAALGRRGAIASESELSEATLEQVADTELAPVEYEAKRTFGLDDLIVLVDEPQQAALALPFHQHVMIEGPPGSGKTSVGIMRAKVLYDQQWEKLGLQQESDRPFHDYGSMRILVYNEEMVEYLQSLALSIGVQQVQVMTTKDFFKGICRLTRTLSGTDRQDKPSLRVVKGRREALIAYFAGFKFHAQAYWRKHETELRDELFKLGPEFLALADCLSGWVKRVGEATIDDDQIHGAINVADSLTDVVQRIERGASPTRNAVSSDGAMPREKSEPRPRPYAATIRNGLVEAQKLVHEFVRGICSRAEITKTMFDRPEYQDLKQALANSGVSKRVIEDGDRLWHRQYGGDLPAYSELDLAMSAWLGAKLLLSRNGNRKPWLGGRLERLSHIVVDEAQDLSPGHLAVLTSQLSTNGTMTLVGDLHQNLNPHAGLRRWEDAELPDATMRAFAVNHRQTHQLGEFIRQLYSGIFGEACLWKPSPKTTGERPRVGVARSWDELAHAVAVETRHWREAITGASGATVAVLYDGRMERKRLKWLKQKLEADLSDMLLTVEAALPGSGGEALRRTDRVVIASVRQTKGLEFDAVVFVEPRPRWAKPVEEIDLRLRNGFYVGTSRARAGLSLCMSNLPSCLDQIANDGACVRIEWGDLNARGAAG